jgi:hypothetical protein
MVRYAFFSETFKMPPKQPANQWRTRADALILARKAALKRKRKTRPNKGRAVDAIGAAGIVNRDWESLGQQSLAPRENFDVGDE